MLDGKLHNYTDWTVGAVMFLPECNNYAYRITLKYQDGKKAQQQKSGFKLKTLSSKRELPIPDYVFEAILEERKLYEKRRNRRKKQFQDLDYICCSSYGRPRSRDFHWKHYKKLLKAVSKLMGHAKEVITVDVQGYKANIIPDEIPGLLEYMYEVLPEEAEGNTDAFFDNVADTSDYIT